AKRFGDLHGKGSHTARCTVDEDGLPYLNFSFVAKALQRGDSRDWQTCCLFERNLLWLHGKLRRGSASVFRKGAFGRAENGIAGLEWCDFGADRFNYPGNIRAEPRKLRPAHSGEQADERWRGAEEVPVIWIHRGGVNPDQDLTFSGSRFWDFL